MVSAKGKEKVTDGFAKGKRKGGGDDDKTGRKRKNRGVVQFFEDEAYDVDEDEDSSDESMFDLEGNGLTKKPYDFVDEFSENYKVNKEPARDPNLHFVKEEDMSEEELDRMLEERYKPGAGFVTYMEDGHDHKKSIDRNIYVPSSQDSIIWKVKCMIGRERFSAFCLMQKFADMVYLGNKLQIISACAVEHVKGFIFIEAEKQQDIYEACKGLSSIYSSRVAAVPTRELSRLLSVRSKSSGISEGMWARVKNGMYKGDLAQVVAVNHDRKKTTVKLVPRIDLKAMAEKIAAGVTGRTRRTVIPAQRLISSSELEEFRPLIQSRRDRETNQMFEILDGMMLKDGYLYKKISIDSLSFWGVMPTEDELLKFESSKKEESTDVQWLSQLFGEKEKKKKEVEIVKDKGGGKSEGVSSACIGSNFEMHELVFFGRKDFGVVIGSEKGDSVKVLKEGSEGSSVVTVKQTDLRSASFDKKLFSVLDQHSNTLSVNDTVRVLEGPLKDRQGIVKKIYGGVLFLCDECEQENNGYICVKAKLCEKVCGSVDASKEKGSEPGPSNFADIPSSPKSPLSTDKSWQERDSNNNNFKRDDNDIFSVGQSLRIRVGPLKGYRCRVLAVRRSDVTVKLDSQQKILTVKSEHLSEVREKNSAVALGDGSGSIKPFDFLGTQDGARDWGGTAPSTDGDNWNVGGSTERSSWSALPSSSILMAKDSVSGDDNATKGAEDSSWQVKASPDQNSSWGAPASCSKEVTETGSLDGWGKPVQSAQDDSWGAAAKKQSTEVVAWGHSGASSDPETSAWKKDSDALDKSKQNTWENKDKMDKDASSGGWGMGGGSAWGSKDISGGSRPVIGSSPTVESESGAWGNAGGGGSSQVAVETGGWGKSAEKANEDASGKSSWGNSASKSSWGQQADVNNNNNNNTASSDGWGKTNVSNKEDKTIKDSETGNGWNSSSQNKDNNSGGWNVSRDSNNNTSGWGGSSKANEESGAASGWGKEKKTNENSQSAWNASTPSLDENKGGNWGSQKTSEETSGGWNSSGNGKNESGSSWKNNGGSAAGWGQSNWLKNEGNAVGGNQDSTWSSKSNWNSDNQDNNGSGGWRGGRGGRGDRGGFRGRGGSDRGGFGGRGVGRGGFGGRDGSDRGGFGGRGGSDREGGYRGRGGFRGRGGRGGDWNNRGDDSNVDSKSYSWGKSSQNDGEGWKSGGNGGGNWGQKDSGANNLSQNWGQPKGDSSQSGGWKNGGGDSTWGQAKGDSSDMRQSKESRQDEGAGNNAWGKAASSSWGAASTGDGNSSGDWKKSEGGMDGGGQRKDEGPSDGWGKAATTSTWGSGGGSGGW